MKLIRRVPTYTAARYSGYDNDILNIDPGAVFSGKWTMRTKTRVAKLSNGLTISPGQYIILEDGKNKHAAFVCSDPWSIFERVEEFE